MKTNLSKSIRDKLLNIAKIENVNYQLILIRYFHERLLYRLSISKYNKNFCLKGGVLLYIFEEKKSRPTIDIDLLALKTKNEPDNLKKIFTEICKIKYDDAVFFNYENITISEITKQANYKGVRINLTAKLDTIKQRLQIDIGFGDKIYPNPLLVNYPVILAMEQPKIQVYSIYSAIAEKFEAMIQLSEVNSRMKDFYDIYTLLTNNEIDKNELKNAIKLTFKTRKTKLSENHSIFTSEFYQDKDRLKQWEVFKRKIKTNNDLSFETVLKKIKQELEPIYEQIKKEP